MMDAVMDICCYIYISLSLQAALTSRALSVTSVSRKTLSLVDLVGAVKMTGDWTNRQTVEDFCLI